MIRATHPSWTAEVVANPDAILTQPGAVVATADAAVLDRCGAWMNLARALVEAHVPGAFLVDLAHAALE